MLFYNLACIRVVVYEFFWLSDVVIGCLMFPYGGMCSCGCRVGSYVFVCCLMYSCGVLVVSNLILLSSYAFIGCPMVIQCVVVVDNCSPMDVLCVPMLSYVFL